MSDLDLFSKVQIYFEEFQKHLTQVHQELTSNVLHASLDEYQAQFLKIVSKCMLSPFLWQKKELFYVQYTEERRRVFVNAVFPPRDVFTNTKKLEKLRSQREFVDYTPELMILCRKSCPELTYLCNLFSILGAWQKATEIYQKYRKFADKSSFLYKVLPLNTITVPSFLLDLQCRVYVYKLMKLMHDKPSAVPSIQAQFSSERIKSTIKDHDWLALTIELEKILKHHK